jgi:hypothetical protein
LGSAAESVPGVALITTNGVTQLAIDGSPSEIASAALRAHYSSAAASAVGSDVPLAGPAAEEPADSAAKTEVAV